MPIDRSAPPLLEVPDDDGDGGAAVVPKAEEDDGGGDDEVCVGQVSDDGDEDGIARPIAPDGGAQNEALVTSEDGPPLRLRKKTRIDSAGDPVGSKRRRIQPSSEGSTAPKQKAKIRAASLADKPNDESMTALAKACLRALSVASQNKLIDTLAALGPEVRGFTLCSGSEVFSVVCAVLFEAGVIFGEA